MKVGHAVHVEGDEREIGGLSVEKRDDRVDGALDFRRRWHLVRAGRSLREPRTRRILSVLGELNRNDAAVAPGEAAHANCRMEERKTPGDHFPDSMYDVRRGSQSPTLAEETAQVPPERRQ